jgi:hypothetical protein
LTGSGALQDSGFAIDERLDLGGPSDTQDNHVRISYQCANPIGFNRTKANQTINRLSIHMSQYGQWETILKQISANAMAHQAKADESDSHFC